MTCVNKNLHHVNNLQRAFEKKKPYVKLILPGLQLKYLPLLLNNNFKILLVSSHSN